MPSAVRGAASPWFTGAGSDLLVTTCELKVPFELQLTDHGQTTNNLPTVQYDMRQYLAIKKNLLHAFFVKLAGFS